MVFRLRERRSFLQFNFAPGDQDFLTLLSQKVGTVRQLPSLRALRHFFL